MWAGLRPRSLPRWAGTLIIGVLAVVQSSAAAAAPTATMASAAVVASAREDPPDVRGLPVREAVAKLGEWAQPVFFRYVPAPDIGLGVDPSLVVVSRYTWLNPNPATAAPQRPVVELILGRRVPDVAGLTRAQADEALSRVAFGLVASPDQAGPDWLVESQRPEPGLIVEFVGGTATVNVSLAPVATQVEPEPPARLSTPVLVVLGVSGLGLGLLILLGAVLVTRSVRRRPGIAPERVEVRAFAGQMTGPDLAERAAGPSPSVRLEPHYDPGTFTLEEKHR